MNNLASQIRPKKVRTIEEVKILAELTERAINESLVSHQNFKANRSLLTQSVDELEKAWANLKNWDLIH
jgi:hypothetical protein